MGHVENQQERGRKRVSTDRDKNKRSHVVKKNRRRTFEDITGIVKEGNSHRFCTRTIKRKIQEIGYKRRVAKKKVARSTKKLGVNGVRRGETGLWIMTGVNGCLGIKARSNWKK